MHANTAALYKVGTEPISGEFYRYIRAKYAHEPLSTVGALEEGRRYNVARLFGALYLGFDRQTCEAEVSQGIAAGLSFKKGAFGVWKISADLQSVVRLDAASVQNFIGVTEADITIKGNHWTASGIGEHLHKRGDVEALVAPSAQLPGGKCLDVFIDDRLQAKSSVVPLQQIASWP